MSSGLAVVAAWMVACQLVAPATAEPDVVVTVLNPSALPPGATLRVFVETPNGFIVERQLSPLTSVPKAVPASPAPGLPGHRSESAAPYAAPMAGSTHAGSGSSREPAPMAGSTHAGSGSSREPAPMAGSGHAGSGSSREPAPMAGSGHAGSGSSREPAPPSSSTAPVAPAEAARIRELGQLRVLIRTRADASPDTPAGARLYGTVLPPSAQGVEIDGAVVLESGGSLTSVRFHAR